MGGGNLLFTSLPFLTDSSSPKTARLLSFYCTPRLLLFFFSSSSFFFARFVSSFYVFLLDFFFFFCLSKHLIFLTPPAIPQSPLSNLFLSCPFYWNVQKDHFIFFFFLPVPFQLLKMNRKKNRTFSTRNVTSHFSFKFF